MFPCSEDREKYSAHTQCWARAKANETLAKIPGVPYLAAAGIPGKLLELTFVLGRVLAATVVERRASAEATDPDWLREPKLCSAWSSGAPLLGPGSWECTEWLGTAHPRGAAPWGGGSTHSRSKLASLTTHPGPFLWDVYCFSPPGSPSGDPH